MQQHVEFLLYDKETLRFCEKGNCTKSLSGAIKGLCQKQSHETATNGHHFLTAKYWTL